MWNASHDDSFRMREGDVTSLSSIIDMAVCTALVIPLENLFGKPLLVALLLSIVRVKTNLHMTASSPQGRYVYIWKVINLVGGA